MKEAVGEKLEKVDGDFPTCMRHNEDNNDDNTRKNEDLKGKGGGSKSKMGSGSKDLCGDSTGRKSNEKTKMLRLLCYRKNDINAL